MHVYSAVTLSSSCLFLAYLFFFSDTAPSVLYTLSLHDALPIFARAARRGVLGCADRNGLGIRGRFRARLSRFADSRCLDRKSTRLNSSHVSISYAVFCLKKKNENLL